MAEPPVRVLHVITELGVGGAERMLAKLLEQVDRQRFAVEVAVLIPGGALIEDIRALGIPVNDLGMTRGRADLRALWRLVGLIRRFRPDVVQAWLYHAELLATLAHMLTGGRARLLWNIRGSVLAPASRTRFQNLVLRLLALLSGRPDGILVNSRAGQDFHAGLGYRPRRWIDQPNGFDTTRFRPDPGVRAATRAALGLAEETFVFGHVARWDSLKDHPTMFAALARHFEAVPGTCCVFAGDGLEPGNTAIDPAFRDGGRHAARVRLLGLRRDPERLYPAFDAFVSSSSSEGFPNVIGEAMASGLPVVATDAGDSRRLVGEGGWIVPVGDPDALAAALTDLSAMPRDDSRARGAAARARIEDRFALPAIARQYWQRYEALAASRGTVRASQVS